MGAMKTKYQIKQKIMTPDGPGIILEVSPDGWGEYKVRLDGGEEIYVLEEDLSPKMKDQESHGAE